MRTASDLAEEGTLGLAQPGQLAEVAAQVATHLDAEAAALAHGLAGAVMLAALATRPAGRRVVMQKGHDIEIAGPLSALLALTGAEIVEIGSVDRATPAELETALADAAAATFFVADEGLAERGLIELPQFRWIARQSGVPTIVVAPATRNWEGLLDAGADLLVLDAATALDGPAVGIVAGSSRLIAAALAAQACGLGRAFRPMPIALQRLTDALGKLAPTT
jgi:seryl-tRNA(Sec) selenium transferase